jgi:hypothetical protein
MKWLRVQLSQQGIKVKIFSEVRFVCNSLGINTYIPGNERP